jgi:hypothetical protein
MEDIPLCLLQKNANELVIAGGGGSPYNSPLPFNQLSYHDWLFAIDSLGNKLWEWRSPNGVRRGGISSIHSVSGNLYYSGGEPVITGSSTFITKPDITCIDGQLNQVWRTQLPLTNPSTYRGYFSSSVLTPDSTALVAVCGFQENNRPLTHFKVRLSDGEVLYHRQDPACAPNSSYTYEGSLYDVTMLPSGSTVACGSLDVQTTGGERIYGLLIKTNAWGEDLLDDCSTVSSAEPQYAQNEIFIYPNPCSDYFTIEPPSGYMGAYRVRLYAGTSALVREQAYAQSEVPHMDVHDLPTGLYYVQVVSAQGQLLGVGKVVNSE